MQIIFLRKRIRLKDILSYIMESLEEVHFFFSNTRLRNPQVA